MPMSFPTMIARNYSRRSSPASTTFTVLIIGGLLGLLLIADICSADMLPSEESYPITLPDGSTHNLFLEGTSEYNYEVDENGYTVVECIDPSLDESSRCYGKLNNSTGYVESTGFLLGGTDPAMIPGLQTHELATGTRQLEECGAFCDDMEDDRGGVVMHTISATGTANGLVDPVGDIFFQQGDEVTFSFYPSYCLAESNPAKIGGIEFGHFDADWYDGVNDGIPAWPGGAVTKDHKHEYDIATGYTYVDYFEPHLPMFKDFASPNLSDLLNPNTKFKIVVSNGDINTAGFLSINTQFISTNPDTYVKVQDYDKIAIDDLTVYSLSGIDGTTKLSRLQLGFKKDAIARGPLGILPTVTNEVKTNVPGSHSEWRNGALTMQLVEVDALGNDLFTVDPRLSNSTGPQGPVDGTSSLLFEGTVFWHWGGKSPNCAGSGSPYSCASYDAEGICSTGAPTWDAEYETFFETDHYGADCNDKGCTCPGGCAGLKELCDVLVDSVSVGTPQHYQFQNITEDHTVHAVFATTGTCPTIRARELSSSSSSFNAISSTPLYESSIRHGRKLSAITTGTLQNLAILFKFSDHDARTVPSRADMDGLMNGGDSTLQGIYKTASYNQLDIQTTVTEWVTLDSLYTQSYCAGQRSGKTHVLHECLRNALDKVDLLGTIDWPLFDSDQDLWIDSIAFFHSGYAAEWGGIDSDGADYLNRIWSHKWGFRNVWRSSVGNIHVARYHINPSLWHRSGSTRTRIGVIAHEQGHFLGMPDRYDFNGGGKGSGSWSMMANSWGWTGNQSPPDLSACEKMEIGWANVVEIQPGSAYTLTSQCKNNTIFKISAGYPEGEFLLLENRQPCGLDSLLPGGVGGLAVYHYDMKAGEAMTNDRTNPLYGKPEGYPGDAPGFPQSGQHYKCAVVAADGGFEMERNINRGSPANLFRPGDVLLSTGSSHAATNSPIIRGRQLQTTTTSDGSTTTYVYPNTDAYQDGIVYPSSNDLINIEQSGTSGIDATISFTLANGEAPEETASPSSMPSSLPTVSSSGRPSTIPSARPVVASSGRPSTIPSARPVVASSGRPSTIPSAQPVVASSGRPSTIPSAQPVVTSSGRPSTIPSAQPVAAASSRPSTHPTQTDSSRPSARPSQSPSISSVAVDTSSTPSSAPTFMADPHATNSTVCKECSMTATESIVLRTFFFNIEAEGLLDVTVDYRSTGETLWNTLCYAQGIWGQHPNATLIPSNACTEITIMETETVEFRLQASPSSTGGATARNADGTNEPMPGEIMAGAYTYQESECSASSGATSTI